MEDREKWSLALRNLNMNGIIGKCNKKGYTISYQGNKWEIAKDFSNFPKELKRFEKDIKLVFGGRNLGGSSGPRYSSPNDYKPKEGHIESRYVRGVTMKEEAFLEDLKRDLKKEILSEGK